MRHGHHLFSKNANSSLCLSVCLSLSLSLSLLFINGCSAIVLLIVINSFITQKVFQDNRILTIPEAQYRCPCIIESINKSINTRCQVIERWKQNSGRYICSFIKVDHIHYKFLKNIIAMEMKIKHMHSKL